MPYERQGLGSNRESPSSLWRRKKDTGRILACERSGGEPSKAKRCLPISTRRWLRLYKKRPNERTRRLGSWSEVASHTAFHRHRDAAGRLEFVQKWLVSNFLLVPLDCLR